MRSPWTYAATCAGPVLVNGDDGFDEARKPWNLAIDQHVLAVVIPPPIIDGGANNAAPLTTVDPAAALDDLEPLGQSIGDAEIVGLGESVHGAAEEIALKHRTLRFLVEEMGFRSIAWEEDWAVGRQIDPYYVRETAQTGAWTTASAHEEERREGTEPQVRRRRGI